MPLASIAITLMVEPVELELSLSITIKPANWG